MSHYDDDRPQRRKSTRTRSDRDDYAVEDSYKSSRGGGGRQTSLVRRDDSDSADEEINRDFPPGGGYYRETTVRKSGRGPVGRHSDDRRDERSYSYNDSKRFDDYAYSKKSSKSHYDDDKSDRRSDRRSRRRGYSSESSRSRSPPKKERRKSMGEELLASLGLGGAAGALLGKKDKDKDSRSRSRTRGGGRSRSRSRSRGAKGRSKSVGRDQIIQALKAAALAGAGAAFTARKEPGGWTGDKGKRILTAAVAAAGVDGLISGNKDNPDHHSKRDVIGAALAGLATNRLVNGAVSKSRGNSPDRGRGRSESRGGGLGDLAAGGILAGAGKKVYDRFRSKSRGRERSRSSSGSSFDSRSPPRNKRRSQSVSGYAAKGLAALGMNSAADKVDPGRRSPRDSRRYDDNYYDDRAGHGGAPAPGYGNGYDSNVGSHPRGPGDNLTVGPPGGPPQYSLDFQPHHTGDPETDSDSDLGSSSGDEKEHKRSQRKGLITAGLATVATIHAAHSIYQAKEKRDHNRKLLKEGDISKEEAKKRKNKMRLQEAAAVGIAGLGLKGAYSEWKETKEHREEVKEHEEKMERHKQKREARRRKFEEEKHMYHNSAYTSSMPDLRTPGSGFPPPLAGPYTPPPHGAPYSAAPAAHYYDDNPYSSYSQPQMYDPNPHLPPPPPAGPSQTGYHP